MFYYIPVLPLGRPLYPNDFPSCGSGAPLLLLIAAAIYYQKIQTEAKLVLLTKPETGDKNKARGTEQGRAGVGTSRGLSSPPVHLLRCAACVTAPVKGEGRGADSLFTHNRLRIYRPRGFALSTRAVAVHVPWCGYIDVAVGGARIEFPLSAAAGGPCAYCSTRSRSRRRVL